jgi:hypothetical protein
MRKVRLFFLYLLAFGLGGFFFRWGLNLLGKRPFDILDLATRNTLWALLMSLTGAFFHDKFFKTNTSKY